MIYSPKCAQCGYVGQIFLGSAAHLLALEDGSGRRLMIETWLECPQCHIRQVTRSQSLMTVVAKEEQEARFAVFDAESIIAGVEP